MKGYLLILFVVNPLQIHGLYLNTITSTPHCNGHFCKDNFNCVCQFFFNAMNTDQVVCF